jgi:hypothetical protein
MSENLATVLTPKISEERLRAIIAQRPLSLFRRGETSILGYRMVYYPYWCVTLQATGAQKFGKDRTLKLLVTVDAVNGDVGYAKSIPEGAQTSEESFGEKIKVRIGRDAALDKSRDFALGIFMRKIFLLKSVSSQVLETCLVYHPYWIVDVRKSGQRLLKAVDALHGEMYPRVVSLLQKDGWE